MSVPHSTEAVVLRTIDYSDSSLIVRLFTDVYGKVTVMARGARRPKHALHGVLHTPNHITVDYRYKEGRDIQTLVSAELAGIYTALATDMGRSAAALLAIEMLDRAVQMADPHPTLFRLITACLGQLDIATGELTTVVHFYQLHLARQLGFAPQLDDCSRCGRQLRAAVLDTTTGDLICTSCHPQGATTLGAAAVDYLRNLVGTHITGLAELPASAQTKREVDKFLLKYLFIHVDGMDKLRSLKFWRQVQT